jgi:hypothetical protein
MKWDRLDSWDQLKNAVKQRQDPAPDERRTAERTGASAMQAQQAMPQADRTDRSDGGSHRWR